jgi:predicted Zn-dependent protease
MQSAVKYVTLALVGLFLTMTTSTQVFAADKVEESDLSKAYDLVQHGNFSAANKLLKPMVQEQSSNIVARRYFIYVLLKQGRIEEASQQIQAIAKLGANSSFDYWLYAQNYICTGQRLAGHLCLSRALAGLNAPVMFSFLKTYAQKVEGNILLKPTTKINVGNDPKRFPTTPIATKAGA